MVLRALLSLGLLSLAVTTYPRASSSISDVLLSRGRTEPVVAVDPNRPNVIVAGANTNYNAPIGDTFPTAYFTSHDSGHTFAPSTLPVLRPYSTGADPSISIAANGTVFYVFLGETAGYCSGGRSAVLLSTSHDGGRTFGTPRVIDTDPGDDKPYLAVGRRPGAAPHLVVAWTRWHASSSDIWVSRSQDGGATFTRPAMLYSSRSDNFGAVPVIGPAHHVSVFWSTFPEARLTVSVRTSIVMRESSNDGAQFSSLRTVAAPFWGVPRMASPGSLRNFTTPSVSVDSEGKLYVSWAAALRTRPDGSVDADIELTRSVDAGQSWTSLIRVNDSRRADRFMPTVTALANGRVAVAFYDRRSSLWNLDMYAAMVTFGQDGSAAVSRNLRVTRAASPLSDIYYISPSSTCFSPGRFFGDYIGSARCGARTVCVTWTDTQLQVYQETDVRFARVSFPAGSVASFTSPLARFRSP